MKWEGRDLSVDSRKTEVTAVYYKQQTTENVAHFFFSSSQLIIFVASLFLFSLHIFTIFAFLRDSSKQPRQQTKKRRAHCDGRREKNRTSAVTNTITPRKHGRKSCAFARLSTQLHPSIVGTLATEWQKNSAKTNKQISF